MLPIYAADYRPEGYVAFVDFWQPKEAERCISGTVDLPRDLFINGVCIFKVFQNGIQFFLVLWHGVSRIFLIGFSIVQEVKALTFVCVSVQYHCYIGSSVKEEGKDSLSLNKLVFSKRMLTNFKYILLSEGKGR